MTEPGKPLRIERIVYDAILRSCPPVPPERGGILGMERGVITAFFQDPSPSPMNRGAYIPNVTLLNQKIREWAGLGIVFCGLYHSHPPNQPDLSPADLAYIEKFFALLPSTVTTLLFPLVLPGQEICFHEAKRCPNGVSLNRVSIDFNERRTTYGKQD